MECQEILQGHLDGSLCTDFRLLVKASSLLYSREDFPHPYYDSEHLNLIRSSVGSAILDSLEAALKRTALAKASKAQLEGLFITILGVIIAVAYTVMTDLQASRDQLLRILGCHMVLIGERIGLLGCDVTKRRLTEGCHSLWDKTGNFKWEYTKSSSSKDSESIPALEESECYLGLSPDTSSSIAEPQAYVLENNHHQFDDFASTLGSELRDQSKSSFSTGSELVTLAWPTDAWVESLDPALNMTICFVCSTRFPSDEICPACFGPLSCIGVSHDTTPEGGFNLALSTQKLDTSSLQLLIDSDPPMHIDPWLATCSREIPYRAIVDPPRIQLSAAMTLGDHPITVASTRNCYRSRCSICKAEDRDMGRSPSWPCGHFHTAPSDPEHRPTSSMDLCGICYPGSRRALV